ncbi:hypothetical protein ACLIBH_05235 [Virgibacillus sp. W0430]|uniref:hypothetical protein n=1 Tax=Virgibacillus sp. W0430 TaxID=3391580 RepID=UPI003F478345
MGKMLDVILWSVVAFTIVLFTALIMIGRSSYFRFLSSLEEDQAVLVTSARQLVNYLPL